MGSWTLFRTSGRTAPRDCAHWLDRSAALKHAVVPAHGAASCCEPVPTSEAGHGDMANAERILPGEAGVGDLGEVAVGPNTTTERSSAAGALAAAAVSAGAVCMHVGCCCSSVDGKLMPLWPTGEHPVATLLGVATVVPPSVGVAAVSSGTPDMPAMARGIATAAAARGSCSPVGAAAGTHSGSGMLKHTLHGSVDRLAEISERTSCEERDAGGSVATALIFVMAWPAKDVGMGDVGSRLNLLVLCGVQKPASPALTAIGHALCGLAGGAEAFARPHLGDNVHDLDVASPV
mmetsp:Transcript_106673/g.299706  ORF Transcript_106673/g.299706 Transcript_106673/m.299706 type:complete len:291 (-) Transcript_106673:986-1858(-)